jgi:anaerobic magnesium-protoporphyrin IX monomethyl ester cyclase
MSRRAVRVGCPSPLRCTSARQRHGYACFRASLEALTREGIVRIALVYPEVYDMARFRESRKEFPPFGVLYLAASLRDAGHEVDVLKVTKWGKALDLRPYQAVGFSLASSATYGILLSARESAMMSADTLVMVGGVHAHFYPRESLEDFAAHVVSVGESEETILEIVNHHADRNFSGIQGVMFHDETGALRSTPALKVSPDISYLPLPARDLLPVEDFVMNDRLAGRDVRMAHVMFSRGCPFPCTFCAAGQTRIQYRDGESARRELEHLIRNYEVGGFAIVDDNFVVNKSKVRDICNQISDLRLQWSALSRVDTVDPELLGDMASAGCVEIKFGVESGSESLLRSMRKNTTQAQITSAVTWSKEVGIEPKAFIIHGYPGENHTTTRETIELLDRLGDKLSRVSLFRFVPLPGTQVYNQMSTCGGIRGTHLLADWDGDWEKFHIHHNDRHWWGTDDDFEELQESYAELEAFVESRWDVQK